LEGLQGVIFKKPVNPAMLKQVLLQQCRPQVAVQVTSAAGQTPASIQKLE
jgi:hypothetical protein